MIVCTHLTSCLRLMEILKVSIVSCASSSQDLDEAGTLGVAIRLSAANQSLYFRVLSTTDPLCHPGIEYLAKI
jgi:hypothetical protein